MVMITSGGTRAMLQCRDGDAQQRTQDDIQQGWPHVDRLKRRSAYCRSSLLTMSSGWQVDDTVCGDIAARMSQRPSLLWSWCVFAMAAAFEALRGLWDTGGLVPLWAACEVFERVSILNRFIGSAPPSLSQVGELFIGGSEQRPIL